MIASGGTCRGDLLAVDPNNDTLLVTQDDRILRLYPPTAGGFVGGPTSTTTNNVIEGNKIGTDITGTVALGNGPFSSTYFGLMGSGVLIAGATDTKVGGTTAGAENVISGNAYDGVYMSGAGTTGNVVEGNLIGTDLSGKVALGNSENGVGIDEGAANNTIAGALNVISGNAVSGVDLGPGATGDVVSGADIGTDETGTVALGNGLDGVSITGGSSDTIGGSATGAGNVISGNHRDGVAITDGRSQENVIAGNEIGTDLTGMNGIGNSFNGVLVNASDNTIGGTVAGAGTSFRRMTVKASC